MPSYPEILRRRNIVLKHAKLLSCLRSYIVQYILGKGSVGTVVYACKRRVPKYRYPTCVAAKIELITSNKDRRRFLKEVETQKAFYPLAPKIYKVCTEIIGKHEFAVILMRDVDKTLAKYLSVRRTHAQLDQIILQIINIFKYLKIRKLTHGDLALFNIGIVERNDRKSLVLIDFDRASSNIYRPEVDILRIIKEMYTSTNSQIKTNKNKNNLLYLRTKAIPQLSLLHPNIKIPNTVKATAELHDKKYTAYAKAAKVIGAS